MPKTLFRFVIHTLLGWHRPLDDEWAAYMHEEFMCRDCGIVKAKSDALSKRPRNA